MFWPPFTRSLLDPKPSCTLAPHLGILLCHLCPLAVTVLHEPLLFDTEAHCLRIPVWCMHGGGHRFMPGQENWSWGCIRVPDKPAIPSCYLLGGQAGGSWGQETPRDKLQEPPCCTAAWPTPFPPPKRMYVRLTHHSGTTSRKPFISHCIMRSTPLQALHDHGVYLEGSLLKPNMVLPGKS